jgi:hypothetical protein
MKKLIYLLALSTAPAYASGTEIVGRDDGRNITSQIRDLEVEEMLRQTSEFDECRRRNQFAASDSPTARDQKTQAAQECFRRRVSDVRDPRRLQQLSEILNLQQYGLVKSKNVRDIQSYLDDKMYKALTGVDRREADKRRLVESLKFKNKKHLDQALFIDLYKTQLSKNALYEVSRFCFESFRKDGVPVSGKSFGEYWRENFSQSLQVGDVTDTGTAADFGAISDPEKKEKVYEDIFRSLSIGGQNGFDREKLSQFFMTCGALIRPLCDDFKNSARQNIRENRSMVTLGAGTAPAQPPRPAAPAPSPEGATPEDAAPGGRKGAVACLAQNKIMEIKKALADTEKIREQFDQMAENPQSAAAALFRGKIFTPGQDGAETLDNLSNYTSADVLEGGRRLDDQSAAAAERCTSSPELAACENFFVNQEQLDRAKHDVDMEMTLKREVEMARVRELKARDQQKLEDYLREQGYFPLLQRLQAGTLTDEQLVQEIGAQFEAKKMATLAQINRNLGSRQVRREANPEEIRQASQTSIRQSKEERARLAQVVLFNNVITSHLELTRRDAQGNRTSAGRNVNAWRKEEQGLSGAQIDAGLFANLRASDGGQAANGIGANEQLGGMELIDQLLGKPHGGPAR